MVKISRVGRRGEKRVARRIKRFIDDDYLLLENLLIPVGESGFTTEIDKVLISKKGIFCIEAKYWGGYLSGGDQGDWIQTKYIYGIKKQKKLYNPVIQNEGHVRAIERLLNNEYKVLNIVYLTGFEKRSNKSEHVFDVYTFSDFYNSLREFMLEDEVESIYYRLLPFVADKYALRDHAEEVHNLHNKD